MRASIVRMVGADPPRKPVSPPGRFVNGAIGAGVAVYAFLDDLLLGPVLVGLAVWFPWFLVLGAAAGFFTFLNVVCCNWVQRSWDSWIYGQGAKVEAMLEKRRRSRLLRRPLTWVIRDSDVWFTIAAGLIGTVIVLAVARLAGSPPLGQRRIFFGSLAYSVGFAATYTGVGVGIGDLLHVFGI